MSFLDRLRARPERALSASEYTEPRSPEPPLLRALDEAAGRNDGGGSFAALCRRVAEEQDNEAWADDLERVLWLLDDALDSEEPEPGWAVLAQSAATEWLAARAVAGEGIATFAKRWRGFLNSG